MNMSMSFIGGTVRARTFGARTGAIPTTVEEPIVVTSRRCYIHVSTGTAYTVPAGAEVSFNGTTWLSANGTTPAGARYWYCRGESSADYETDVTFTPTLDEVDYPFVVRTMTEPQVGFDYYTDADNYTEVENYVD